MGFFWVDVAHIATARLASNEAFPSLELLISFIEQK